MGGLGGVGAAILGWQSWAGALLAHGKRQPMPGAMILGLAECLVGGFAAVRHRGDWGSQMHPNKVEGVNRRSNSVCRSMQQCAGLFALLRTQTVLSS